MTQNIGIMDRGLRALLGFALIAFALQYVFPATGWNWLGWIGVVPLLTSVFGTCPLYSALGISTCPVK